MTSRLLTGSAEIVVCRVSRESFLTFAESVSTLLLDLKEWRVFPKSNLSNSTFSIKEYDFWLMGF